MRVINFSAGPSSIPIDVLNKAKDELLSYQNLGFSIMEISHRSEIFEKILNSAKKKIKTLYNLGDEFEILFLQGGASLQFAQVPLNLADENVAEYVDSGVWTQKAIKEAQILGINYKVIASSEDKNYSYIPNFKFSDNASYCYICSNNTIYGTQYKNYPSTKAPLVIDASSDLFSKEIDFSNIGLFFGGIQKNGGPSGLCVVIIKKELANRVKNSIPTLLRYKTQIDNNSMSNTPNTFAIYLLDLMLSWIEKNGGLKEIDDKNVKKAKILYECIDDLSSFYQGIAQKEFRSLMNVSFKIFDQNLESIFVQEAFDNNMIGLKGHRIIGGLRASIYNAISLLDVEKLVDFMYKFYKKYK